MLKTLNVTPLFMRTKVATPSLPRRRSMMGLSAMDDMRPLFNNSNILTALIA
jgi:hypothetical protein